MRSLTSIHPSLANDHVIYPVFLTKCTVTSSNYRDMIRRLSLPQLNDDIVIFQEYRLVYFMLLLLATLLMRHFYIVRIGKVEWK